MSEPIIGTSRYNDIVYIPDDRPNEHIFAVGTSGSGKTTTLLSILVQIAMQGKHIIVLNWHGSTARDQMPEYLRNLYDSLTTVIRAKDGIRIPLFSSLVSPYGEEETENRIVHRVTGILGRSADLSPTRIHALQEAVRETLLSQEYHTHGVKAIERNLLAQEERKATARVAAVQLSGLFAHNVLIDGDLDFTHPILEIECNDLDPADQDILVKVLLEFLLAKASRDHFKPEGLTVFIDEAHNLSFAKDSIVTRYLYEARKKSISLCLATPELPSDKRDNSSVMQAATRLYFIQESTKVIDAARQISPNEINVWSPRLHKLNRGEFILCGRHRISTDIEDTPLLVKAYIPTKESDCYALTPSSQK